MTYCLRSLAFGCAVAALGAVLPTAASHAQESVPGMLRCFEGGIETSTIGPIFRVWSARDEANAPAPGADGCHWQPMSRIAMPGAVPPDQAMVSGGRRIQMPRPADSDTENEAAAMAAMGGDVVDVPSSPASPPPLPPGDMAGPGRGPIGADGLRLGGAEVAGTASDVVIMPAVEDRSARLPIDLSVAAQLTAGAIAVEIVPLPEPVPAGSIAERLPGSSGEDLSLDLDVALTETPAYEAGSTGAGLTRTNPHPPRIALSAVAVAPGPRQPLRPDPHPDQAVGPALLATLAMPAVGHDVPVLPMALAETLTSKPSETLAAPGPASVQPASIVVAASDTLPEPRPNPHAGIAVPQVPEPPVVLASTTPEGHRPNPHAGIAVPQVPEPPVVLASTTPDGHRPNPHAPLPDGWGTESEEDPLFIAADLPLRGGPALTQWAATAGDSATPDLKAVTLPGWDGRAPRIVVARSAAVVPPAPPEAPTAPELLIAEAEAVEDVLKVQTARRAGGDAEVAEAMADAAALPAVGRDVIEVATSPAVVPEETVPVVVPLDAELPAEVVATVADAAASDLEPTLAAAASSATDIDQPAEPAPTREDGWWLQLASLTSPAGAMREWDRRQSVTGDLLSAMEPTVVRADIPNRGVFYRLWLGPFDNAREAARLCARIERYGEACFVHRMDGQPVPREEVASLPR